MQHRQVEVEYVKHNNYRLSPWPKLGEFMACLVDCNGNYIGIRIDIIMNTKCCNVILITIYLFGDNAII